MDLDGYDGFRGDMRLFHPASCWDCTCRAVSLSRIAASRVSISLLRSHKKGSQGGEMAVLISATCL